MADEKGAINLKTGGPFGDEVVKNDPPSAKVIEWFLSNANSQSPTSVLHRLGYSAGTAAEGNHTHDGRNSPYLFDSTPAIPTVTASSTTAQLASAVIAITQHLQSRGAGQSTE